MTTPALLLSRNSFVGLGKEAQQGTYVPPTFFVPGTSYKPQDVPTYEDDTAMEGNIAKVQNVVQGIKDATFGLDHNFYYEVIPNWLVALGFVDTVTSFRTVADGVTNSTTLVTSATGSFKSSDVGAAITGTGIPASTTIAAVVSTTNITLSQAATASASGVTINIGTSGQSRHLLSQGTAQPPSYSITDFVQSAGISTRGYPGMMLDSLGITIDAKSIAKVTTAWKGWPSASQSKPTPAYPGMPAHGWQAAFTIGGTARAVVDSFALTAKRNVEAVHTNQNNQAPYNVFAGEIEAQTKVKGVYLDDTELNNVLNNTQPPMVMTLTSPTGSPAPAITLTMSKTAWKVAQIDRSSKYIAIDADIECVQNATDGGIFSMLLVNGVSTTY